MWYNSDYWLECMYDAIKVWAAVISGRSISIFAALWCLFRAAEQSIPGAHALCPLWGKKTTTEVSLLIAWMCSVIDYALGDILYTDMCSFNYSFSCLTVNPCLLEVLSDSLLVKWVCIIGLPPSTFIQYWAVKSLQVWLYCATSNHSMECLIH